ncbi:MAG: radical SAM family heme chaperone HemW [Oscillospiraceae bacterium]|jgi:oxygen-independent coproporphyrinogen-3 oxidase|nr:radical SAM family heme chaperone HemW [Oscillospiraceae bacterium]MBQ2383051.1 radical SAM family heme chaperone HemW [Oscillospiraceae bacterium]MBQ5711754.1 radical SAM family heme chaperone HemW [Oscillospiraceae bacterium]
MPILPRNEKTPLGIYIHIPFCHSKCVYCDFYSEAGHDEELMDAYRKAICTHIKETGPLTPGYRVDTVYFGGGTPSFFGADGLAAILTAVRQSFDVSPQAEITFEANPDSVTPRLLRRLRSEGFNRVSLGVQNDDDAMLHRLGRPHTYEQVEEAVRLVRKIGFQSLSVDLMFGLPEQTLQGWQDTLTNVLKLKPDHISCYGLEVKEGTPLYTVRDHCGIPMDETQADMYLAAVELLRAKGYRQYEISNFAKKGHHSRHNMKYWQGGEFLGFGASASSDFGGKRFTMVSSICAYIDGIKSHGQVIDDLQDIPLWERAGEYLMTRLRTTAGISREEYEKQYLLPFDPLETILQENRDRYLTIFSDGRWRFSPEGFLVSNSILSDLLLAQDRSIAQKKRAKG